MSSPSRFTDQHFVPIAISAGLPITVTIPMHGFLQGYAIRATRFVDVPYAPQTGMVELNNRLFYVTNPTENTFELVDVEGNFIDGRAYTPFTGEGNPQFTLTGPNLFVQNPPLFPPF